MKMKVHDVPVEGDEYEEIAHMQNGALKDIVDVCDKEGLTHRLVVACDEDGGKLLVAVNGGMEMSVYNITMALAMLEEATKVMIGKLPQEIQRQMAKRVDKKAQH